MDDVVAPSEYKTAGILMIVSASLTLLFSGIALLWMLISIIGICFMPYYLLPIGAAIFELIGGIGALQGKRNPGIKANSIVGLVGAVLGCNIFSIILEIIALVFLGNSDVSEYLKSP